MNAGSIPVHVMTIALDRSIDHVRVHSDMTPKVLRLFLPAFSPPCLETRRIINVGVPSCCAGSEHPFFAISLAVPCVQQEFFS